MNIYINFEYLTIIYFVSMIFVFVICAYALINDYLNGVSIIGGDIVIGVLLSIVPVINTYVLVMSIFVLIREFCGTIIFKRK